jgi:5-(carboxyamino)imidazole ribonucleotide mutase
MPVPVAIVMGSQSDWATMSRAAEVLEKLEVPTDIRIVSAHRTPDRLVAFAKQAADEGFRVIIAGAGGAAHLPGMVASLTPLPVIGVPVESKALKGLDSLLSIVQMPGGVPVATVAIGGGRNAGLLAVRLLAATDPALQRQVLRFQSRLAAESRARGRTLRNSLSSPSPTKTSKTKATP